ncbi:immunoglobulin-like domain-containing protein [Treponema sp. HNW]|uniref:immunoglobulin-like domain-containing protein n=1 Tax=Treponema sp. HNW TaxID=3116654 RepID=UPI003D0DC844
MKRLFKTIFGLSIAALLTVFISCPQPIGPGGGTNPHTPSNPGTVPAVPSQTPVEKALAELTVSPLKVFKETTKVNLPTATSVPDVTISWTALPEGYINVESGADLGKILKRETEDTEVTLTATATKDGETKTKTFKITIHPETAEPDAQALAAGLAIQPAVSADFTLPKTVSGYSAAAITWESADDKIIKIEEVSGQKKAIITYDLIDKAVTLTASIHYDDGNPDTPDDAEKTFSVTVKRVEKITEEHPDSISTYEFTGNEYIRIHTDKLTGKIKSGTKYTYTDVQTAADGTKTALFTQTAIYQKTEGEATGKWMTKTETLQEIQQYFNTALSKLAELKKKNLLKLENFQIFPGLGHADTREKMFKNLQWFPDENNPLKTYTFETFDDLEDAQESAELKKMLLIIEKFLNQNLPVQIAMTESMFGAYKCKYEFYKSGSPETINFYTNILYNPAKPWYEQRGVYGFLNSASPVPAGEIMGMDLSVRERDQNQYEASIDISISDGTNPSKNYNGPAPYTSGTTAITATLQESEGSSGPSISVTISGINVDAAGKMTANVQIDTGAPQSLTLKFEGRPLN